MITKASDTKRLLGYEKSGKICAIDEIGVLRKPKDSKWISKEFKSKKSVLCIVGSYIFGTAKILFGQKKVTHVCHPFRDEILSIFPEETKKILLSQSDFCDEYSILTEKDIDSVKFSKFHKNIPYYDFIYFAEDGQRGIESKGIYIMDILNEASKKLCLIGMVVVYGCKGVQNYDFFIKKYSNLHIINKFYSQEELNFLMKKAKFIFFPNTLDASPRMITESLVRKKPVVVNRDIMGGWKYINSETGVFFNSLSYEEFSNNHYDRDLYVGHLYDAFKQIMSKEYNTILNNYYSKYGFLNSSKRLSDVVNDMIGTNKYEYVFYEELKQLFLQCLRKGPHNL